MQRASKRFYVGSIFGGQILGALFSLLGQLMILVFGMDRSAKLGGFLLDGKQGSLLLCCGFVFYAYAWIVSLELLYKAWGAIQHGSVRVRTTPGKAVGFLFIPFFNLYWIFQALWGWTKDYNAVVSSRNPQGLRATQGLGLLLCIFTICLSLLGPFVSADWWPYLGTSYRIQSWSGGMGTGNEHANPFAGILLFLLLVWFTYLVVQAMFWSEVCDGINALAADSPSKGPPATVEDPAA